MKKIKPLFKGKNYKWLKFLPKTLSKVDRYLLTVLILIIVASSFAIWYRHFLKTTHEIPNFGSTLTEGIVGEPKDLQKQTIRLTNAGLTRLAENGDVIGDLAASWQILDDGKTYQFKIRGGYSAMDLLGQIQNKDLWSSIDISAADDQTLVFKFKQPFSPFLYTSTEPIFSYGPYKISSETNSQVILDASTNYWHGKPYISQIKINLYPDYNALTSAAKRGEIMGYQKEQKDDFNIYDSGTYEMGLPRYLNLFFNLSRPALEDVAIRKNLRDGKNLNQGLDLTLVTSDTTKNKVAAEKIKTTWKNYNVNINVKIYDNIALQKDIIPNRNYDVLLYGQDYGPDPDPYPFWHSSQIGKDGINLSNFSNKNADKLLESARQTFDLAQRNQKYKDFQAILDQEVPYINIEKESCFYVLSNDIKGVNKIYGSSEADRFLNVNQWYIKTKRVKN